MRRSLFYVILCSVFTIICGCSPYGIDANTSSPEIQTPDLPSSESMPLNQDMIEFDAASVPRTLHIMLRNSFIEIDEEKTKTVKDENYSVTGCYEVQKYDSSGNLIIAARYSISSDYPDGRLLYTRIYERYDDGTLKLYYEYNDGDILHSIVQFTYGTKTPIKEYNFSTQSGYLTEVFEYSIDGNAWPSAPKKKLCYENGIFSEYKTFEYDENQNLTGIYSYTVDDALDSYCIQVFDEFGHCIEQNSYDSNNNRIQHCTASYDSKGMVDESYIYDRDGTLTFELYTIYIDEKPDYVYWSQYNADGSTTNGTYGSQFFRPPWAISIT